MEYWDVLDKTGKPLGYTHLRGKPMRRGERHLVTDIIVTNGSGKLLLMYRHPDKPYGDCWEITGGSVLSGESSLEAAQRELSEETGITVPLNALEFVQRTVGTGHAIYDAYHTVSDTPVEKIVFQDGETTDACWVSSEEYLALCSEGRVCDPCRARYQEYILALLEKEEKEEKHEDICC